MKIGQYCQRQRCKHVELEQFLAGFLRRAGLSAIAGLSCFTARCYAQHGIPMASRMSVRLSVLK